MSSYKIGVSQLTLHNPARMKDAEIMSAFVARTELFGRLLAEIAAERPESRAQHHLIVGQRGMGKSTLLARIGAELRAVPELAARFVPLAFAEEQYAVDRLSKFWLNCLDSLADAAERAGDVQTGRAIDAAVNRLRVIPSGTGEKDEAAARAALDEFLAAARRLGKRPVLLVDNLQLVFDRIAKLEQHALREVLMRPGCPILIGAAPNTPSSSLEYGAAFFDHFKIQYLKALSADEMRELMLRLAETTERPDVREKILTHPGRLKALRELTGGNPRTVVILFFLYAEDFSTGVFADLENLLDRVTPLYKARIEELSEQQQVIVSAVADHWAPVSGRELSELTGIPPASISGQLDRLENIGVVEKVELFDRSIAGYQIAERFFNVWFLMRNASRRQRREAEFLVRFIESFYEEGDRSRLADGLMSERDLSADRYQFAKALASTLDPNDKEELTRHAELDALRRKEAEARRKLEEVIDFGSLPAATLAFDELRRNLEALVPRDGESFADLVLGDRRLFMSRERERLAASSEPLSEEKIAALLESVQAGRASDEGRYGETAAEWLRKRLSTGQLRSPDDLDDWNRAFRQTKSRRVTQLLVDTIGPAVGSRLSEDVVRLIKDALEPRPESSAVRWYNWGYDLQMKMHNYREAESAYRRAIELAPNDSAPWINLGHLLNDHLERYEESECAYRRAIELNPTRAATWVSLGYLLQYHKGRYEESEAAYRRAVEIDSGLSSPWNALGNLYCDYLLRFEDAASAFARAIELDESNLLPRHNLVSLLRDFLGSPGRALVIFERLKTRDYHRYQDALHLHDALFAAYDSNWGLARAAFSRSLDFIGDHIPSCSAEDWFRACAVLIHVNYGEEFLALLRERGDDSRLRPLYEAVSALQRGDRRYLLNIAVEARGIAEKYFDQIERRLNVLPESTRRRVLPTARDGKGRGRRRK